MIVNVQLFAGARDLAGQGTVTVEISPGATVADLRSVLVKMVPTLANVLPKCVIALNHDYAMETDVVPADAEVALIPPVSGG